MKILIVGAGMYVTGRYGTGVGTLLSSLAEMSKVITIESVTVIATNPSNQKTLSSVAEQINKTLGSNLKVVYENVANADYDQFQSILKKNSFDCSIVSVPDHLHFAFGTVLLKNRVPALIVKPLTPNLMEALELERLGREFNVYSAVEFHKRWDETNLWVKKSLNSNKLGKILYFTVDYSQKISMPMNTFSKWAEFTNIFQYLGVHYVDLIWYLTKYRPVKAIAYGAYGVLKSSGINTYDAVLASIVWQSQENSTDQFVSQFAVNWIDPNCTSAMSDQKYKIIGTSGRIECDQKNRGLELVHQDDGIQQINPYFAEVLPSVDGGNGFVGYGFKSVKQFLVDVSDLSTGRIQLGSLMAIRPTLKEGLVSTAVIESVNKSLKNNSSWEDIPNVAF